MSWRQDITLVEALSLDGFKITEVSQGGSVPDLRVSNETPHHVLLFDGEDLRILAGCNLRECTEH